MLVQFEKNLGRKNVKWGWAADEQLETERMTNGIFEMALSDQLNFPLGDQKCGRRHCLEY